jgi:hypothetical protein
MLVLCLLATFGFDFISALLHLQLLNGLLHAADKLVPKYCTPGSPSWTLVNLFDFMGGELSPWSPCTVWRPPADQTGCKLHPSDPYMGTLAETAIVDFCSAFTYKGKQTSVFWFHLQQTNGSLLLWGHSCTILFERPNHFYRANSSSYMLISGHSHNFSTV